MNIIIPNSGALAALALYEREADPREITLPPSQYHWTDVTPQTGGAAPAGHVGEIRQ